MPSRCGRTSKNKLAVMSDLPTSGGHPLHPGLNKDFGDTVAMMLSVSSPPVSNFEVERRAEVIARRLAAVRNARPAALRDRRMSGVLVHPAGLDPARLSGRRGRRWRTLRNAARRMTASTWGCWRRGH